MIQTIALARRAARERARGAASMHEPRPKVLFLITTTGFGGTETFLLELVRGLPLHGIDPLVCSLCPPGHVGTEMVASGANVVTLGMESHASPAALAQGIGRLARMIDEENVDLVQTLLYRANVMGALAARISRRRPPVVSSQRSLTPGGATGSAHLVKWTRRLASVTVAVSEAARREIIRMERLAPENVIVIPNGVDTLRFSPRERAACRAVLGLPQEPILVGGVGRLSREKGFHVLIDAVAIASKEGTDFDVVLAGDGPERTSLEQQARSTGVAHAVHFLGVRRDLNVFFPAMDVFALPSLEEGSPNALLEAMACACPAVASDVGGVPELIANEMSGILVPPGSPRALATGLQRLVCDPALRRAIAGKAIERATTAFAMDRTVASHADLYRRLLGQT